MHWIKPNFSELYTQTMTALMIVARLSLSDWLMQFGTILPLLGPPWFIMIAMTQPHSQQARTISRMVENWE